MFLKCSTRHKDGKEHRSWSVVESRRLGRGVVQRHVPYLGEINDSQRAAWQKAVAVFDEQDGQTRQCALFPADRTPPATDTPAGQVQLNQLQLSRPRSWGACWLGDQLWRDLQLDTFFAARLGCSREGTDWEKVLRLLTLYRLLSPGSEWRLHRHWFATTACADLLDVDERLAQDDTLYRGLDGLLEHKDELFAHLRQRWSDLFGAKCDVLLYDLTSTYFECDVPENQKDPRRFGYSRDQRGDCVQVIVALVVTPRRPAAGLRNVPRPHRRQNHAQGHACAHPKTLRPGRAPLGDGPGHSHRRQAGPAPICASREAHWGQGSALSARPKAA